MFRRMFLCAVLFVTLAAPAGAAGPKAGRPAAGRPAIGEETERQSSAPGRAVAASSLTLHTKRRGQIRDAVIRYRRSLAYWPDTGLESYPAPLDRQAGRRAPQQNASAAGCPG